MKTIKSLDGILIDIENGDAGHNPDQKGYINLNTSCVWVKLGTSWIRSPYRSSTITINFIEKTYYKDILKEWSFLLENN